MALGTSLLTPQFLRHAFLAATLAFGAQIPATRAFALTNHFSLNDAMEPVSDFMKTFRSLFDNPSGLSIWAASQRTIFPLEFLNRLAMAESSGDPNAQETKSSACGLMQLTDEVLYQKLFEYGERYGYDGGAYIERTRESHRGVVQLNYRLRDLFDKDKVRALCNDPYFATLLGSEHMRDVVVAMQESLKRPVTYSEAYLGYVFGPNAGLRIVHALHDRHSQRSPAASFVRSAAIRANPALFYHDGRHRLQITINEIGAIFTRKMGDQPLPLIEGRKIPVDIATP